MGDEVETDKDVEGGGTSGGLEWSCWTPREAWGSRRDLRRREVVLQVTLWSAAAVLDVEEVDADGVDADGNGVDADGEVDCTQRCHDPKARRGCRVQVEAAAGGHRSRMRL